MSTRLTVVPEHVCVQEHTYTGAGVLCAVSSPSPSGHRKGRSNGLVTLKTTKMGLFAPSRVGSGNPVFELLRMASGSFTCHSRSSPLLIFGPV